MGLLGVGVDHVDVEGGGQPDDVVDDRSPRQLRPPGAAARAQDELGGPLRLGEVDERGGDVSAGDPVVRAPELEEQGRVFLQQGRGGFGKSVVIADVDPEEVALRAGGHAGGPPDELLPARRAGEGDHHPFPGFPRADDPVRRHVALQRVLDPVGDPEQRQLAQGGQVADAEVVAEGGVDLLGGIDVAVGHPAPERLRAHVDELDVVGGPDHRVGNGLALDHPGDLVDHVVDALEVLDVDGRDDLHPMVEELLDVLPALLVLRSRDVGVGQLVDQDDVGLPGEDGIDVHLVELGPAVLEHHGRHDLQVADLGLGLGAVVGHHHADHDVRAARVAPEPLVEHGEGLADAGCRSQVDPQLSRRHPHSLAQVVRRRRQALSGWPPGRGPRTRPLPSPPGSGTRRRRRVPNRPR